MSQLDPKTKALIEQRFIDEEEERAKRRQYYRKVFLVGFPAGCCSLVLFALMRRDVIPSGSLLGITGLISAALAIVWVVCILKYTGTLPLPKTFAQNFDIRWRLNPWKESLDNLKEEAILPEAIALLGGPILVRMVVLFAVLIFKSLM